MQAEIAFVLPALGAACAFALRSRQRLALTAGFVFGLGGVVAIAVSAPAFALDQTGLELSITPQSRALLVAAGITLLGLVAVAPAGVNRSPLLVAGLVGLSGLVAIAAAPTLDLIVLSILVLAVLHAAIPARGPLAVRLQAPAMGAVLLAGGMYFTRLEGTALEIRIAAVALVAGVVAAVGALPWLPQLDPEDSATSSPIPWAAFLGPVLAVAALARARALVPDAENAFGAMLVGIGMINVVWATIAAWRVESGVAAWRYSFLADMGLVLCGLGLAVPDGAAGAQLVLYGILLGRLPLYLWSRPALRERAPNDRPLNLWVAAALAGSAPFAGFPARVLLLRGATQVYWPLALVLALSMLLWLPSSLRLGRSLGRPRGRTLVGIGVVLIGSVAVGLYPALFLSAAGL